MNWQFTREGIVRFAKDEPICLIFPVLQGLLDRMEPVLRDLREDPELERQFAAWTEKRAMFMGRYNAQDPATFKQAWQRYYFRGELPAADIKAPSHQHKLRLKAPVDKRKR
jgi:hypothetical protein